MSLITEVETQLLEHLNETLTGEADNWTGTDEVRDAVVSAIDELAAVGKFRKETVYIPLEANVSVYSLALEEGMLIGIYGAQFVDQQRRLAPHGLTSLSKQDPSWLLSRGSPWAYVPLDFTKILFYPCPSSSEGQIALECLLLPDPYSTYEIEEDISWEWTGTLVDGALSYLYLLIPGEEKRSLLHYQRFLAVIGAPLGILNNWNRFVARTKRGLQEE